jgi:phospholipase/lecithinase/hemolysin
MRKITFLSLYVTLLFGAAASAFAIDFSRFNHLVVFGDSLSDNANSWFLTQRALPPSPLSPPYGPYGNTYDTSGNLLPDTFPGRWTDGQNWVDYFPLVANHLVTPFYADRTSGSNVAVAGSTSADLLQSPGTILHGQIPDYIQARGTLPGGRISSDDLYCVWIGANDFKAQIAPQRTAANILKGITALARAGAKQFILVDCPDISLTPEVRALDVVDPGTVQAAKQFVAAVNVLLAVETPLIAWQQRINVTFVDINTIFVPLVLNPAFFGFSNSMDTALIPPGYVEVKPNTNPNSFVFWDGFHPTTNVHKLAAQFIYRVASSRFPFSILSSR